MKELISDAVGKGAKILNKDGGKIIGGSDSTLMVPAVLYNVTPEMKLYHEEQFGPVIPIALYDDIETVLEFGQTGPYGQQVSVFTAMDSSTASNVIDRFSAVFGKINLNSQCGRSPDTLPFSGRRSSALGVMSVSEALREVSNLCIFSCLLVHNNSIGCASSTNTRIPCDCSFLFLLLWHTKTIKM